MAKLLETLYTECQGYLELRALKNKPKGGKQRRNEFFLIGDHKGISGFLAGHKGWDCYFAVATRDGAGGRKANIVSIPAVWCDVDFKDIPQGDADKRLADFPCPPTIIVQSGGGYHLYWKLKEPAEPEDIPEAESVMRSIAMVLGGDLKATDASRILRIPGTRNFKYRPPRAVVMSHCNGSTYNLFDIAEHLPHVERKPKPTYQPTTKVPHPPLENIMRCKFMRMCQDHAADLPEGSWYAMVTQLAKERGGHDLIHQLSRGYPRYSVAETTDKILHAINDTGPITCERIKATLWDCKDDCGVRSPAALAYRSDPPIQDDMVSGVSNVSTVSIVSTRKQASATVSSGKQASAAVSRISDQQEPLSITAMIREWVSDSTGYFTTQMLDQDFNFRTRKEKNARARALYILSKERKIIKDRIQKGKYHILDDNVEWYDPDKEPPTPFQMEMPFGLDDLVVIPPKSIVVVAGTTNAGKTAVLLNIAAKNLRGKAPIVYLMSEMGPWEFRARQSLFSDIPAQDWRKMRAAERSHAFNAVIYNHNRDGITLIDYLEDVGGEYYKIASGIRDIYDALGDGVAIIALQKKSGVEYGRGGEATAEKSRLYLAVDKLLEADHCAICSLKIIKAKVNKPGQPSSTGKELHFKLISGSSIYPLSHWARLSAKQRNAMVDRYRKQFCNVES